ncbi:MAG TPA: amidohydrolase family protein [Pirellulaceae bacterium]|nr:amidohydrolase family protein [Pirellulaceae bacterium]
MSGTSQRALATTRREFNSRLLRAVAGVACGAAAGLKLADGPNGPTVANAAAQKEFPPGRYVDMHTHLGQTWNTTTPLTAEELLRWMDAHQISQAIVLPLVSPESSSYLLTSDFVLAQTQPFRDRLIPFCCIDPRTSYNGGAKGLLDMLKKYVDAGAKGFGEHKPGVAIDDPRNMALYAACGEVKLPLLFHLDNIRNTDKPGLPGLEKALAEHPQTTFIAHGPGWWASISGGTTPADLGGYPKGKVAPGGAIDTLMGKYPNIFGDMSAGSGAGAFSRDLEYGRDLLIRRSDRFMFGTDFLAPGQAVPQFELVEKQLNLPDDVAAKVFRENARRVLRLTA